MMQANSVLRKDRLWREMLVSDTEDSEFVFSLSASRLGTHCSNGIVQRHAYSILKATEVEDEKGDKVRLVKIRYVIQLINTLSLSAASKHSYSRSIGILGEPEATEAKGLGMGLGQMGPKSGLHT